MAYEKRWTSGAFPVNGVVCPHEWNRVSMWMLRVIALCAALSLAFPAFPALAAAKKGAKAAAKKETPVAPAPRTEAPAGPLLTLPQCLEIAAERDLDLKSAQDSILISRSAVKEAFTQFLPKLSTSYSYTRLHGLQVFMGSVPGIGGLRNRDLYQWNSSFNQPIFTGFALETRYDLAKLNLDVAAIQKEGRILDLQLAVKEVYYEIIKAQKLVKVASQAVKTVEDQLRDARAFFKTGVSPKIDVLNAEVRLVQEKQNLTVAENAVALAKAQLNSILRESLEREFSVEDILTVEPFSVTVQTCYTTAADQRPEIRAASRQVDISERSVKLAQSDFYPTLSAQGNYNRSGDSPKFQGSALDPSEDWNVGVALTWTFFEWGKTVQQVNQSRLKSEQAKLTLAKVEDDVRLQVKEAYLHQSELYSNIVVTEKNIERAEENLRLSRERYRQQVTTTTEVLDALRDLTEARSRYTSALGDYNTAVARLARAMGVSDLRPTRQKGR